MKVVVGVDASPSAERAFRRALGVVAKLEHATLVVVHIVDVVQTSILDPFHDTLDHLHNVDARENAARVRDKFERLCNDSLDRKVRWQYLEIEAPSPKEAIVNLVEENVADLLVVGRRGLGPLDKLLLGSTSEYLVEHVNIPVMVVH